MMRLDALFWTAVCSLVVWLQCVSCHAQALQEPPTYVLHHGTDGGWLECDGSVDCRSIPGERGVWFVLSKAQQLVTEHRVLPEVQAALNGAEGKASLITDRLHFCEQREAIALADAHGAAAALEDAVHQRSLAEARADKAVAQRDAWHRSRSLWFSAGLAAALVFAGGSYALLH